MFLRLTALALALGCVASVATAIARPDWVAAAGLDVWNLPALREQIESGTERREALDFHDSEIRQRIDLKEELIERLIAGSCTLRDTTAQFLAMDQDRLEYMLQIRSLHPATSDEESMARNVMQYTYDRLEDESVIRRLEVMTRLEIELRELRSEPTVITVECTMTD